MSDTVRAEPGGLRVGSAHVPLVAGEIQFWRMDPHTWEPAIRAARDAGVTVVSTYLSWRRHEKIPGRFDFDGHTDPRLDLQGFLRICTTLGVLVQLKPGPWICAEEPGGGYPEWLLQQEDILALDDQGRPVIGYNPPFLHPVPSYLHPGYLEAVRAWFSAVWDVIHDRVHPHGPIVALQLDNEPSSCFQDSMYGADYSAVSLAGFQDWLRDRYQDDSSALSRAWEITEAAFDSAQPPRRPLVDGGQASPGRRRDWIDYKTFATAGYLETLRRMHVELGGRDLLYTVNLITHPVHDVPVAHQAIREATGAMTGEDHYYVPPLEASDIHRLARSAATARSADETLPWVPELQAGIWRSPGEIVDYPDPTPVEQEIWSGAAIALGFGGFNFYMLADRENWEFSPFTTTGSASSFLRPVERLAQIAQELPGVLGTAPRPAVVVAWHRSDSYDAYAVTGTARELEVEWHDETDTPYRQWDNLLQQLTGHGITYELWDTEAHLELDLAIPLLVPALAGVSDASLDDIRATGRELIHLDPREDLTALLDGLTRSSSHVLGPDGILPDTLVATQPHPQGEIVHVVHWGPGEPNAQLVLPHLESGHLTELGATGGSTFIDGHTNITVTPGHQLYVLR